MLEQIDKKGQGRCKCKDVSKTPSHKTLNWPVLIHELRIINV